MPTTDVSLRTRTIRAGAALSATLLSLVIWVVAVQLLDVDLQVAPYGTDFDLNIGPATVIGNVLGAALLAWALLAVLERKTTSAARTWTGISSVVLVLSLATPLTADATTAAKFTLGLMHIAVGLVLIPTLARSSARRS